MKLALFGGNDAKTKKLDPVGGHALAATPWIRHWGGGDVSFSHCKFQISTGIKYRPLAFRSVDWCKINVFTLNIMVLHHKKSQTINNNKILND